MESVGALNRLGSAFVSRSSIIPSSISAHNFQFWVGSHPGCRSVCCPVCKNIEHMVCLEVHHNRAELAPTSEREIIYANLWNFPNWLCRQRHDAPENGVARGLYSQAICDTDAKSATCSQAEDLHNLIQTSRHTCPRLNKGRQALQKDFSSAARHLTKALAYLHQETYLLPATGQVCDLACIATMYPQRGCATERATGIDLYGNCRDGKHFVNHLNSGYF